jgi:hypothetical protein
MAMIEYQSNADLEQQEQQAAKEAQERQQRPEILNLSHYVMDCWQAAKEAKERKVEPKMVDALRVRAGEYSPTKLQQIKSYGGSEVFMMLTDEKCNAVVAWMNDILFPPGDKPWGVKPTPVPDLEPGQMQEVKVAVMLEAQQTMKQQLVMEIQAGNIQDEQQAKEWMLQNMQARAEELAKQIRDEMEAAAKEARDRIERKLDDVLVEAGWQDAVMDTIDDICTFPSGIIKGPVIRKKKVIRWKDQQQEQVMPGEEQYQEQDESPVEVRRELMIDFNRVSPFDIYPLANAQCPEDGLLERHRLTRKYLTSLIGVEGYDDDAIRMVLTDYGQAGQSSWLSVANDLTRQELENRPNEWRSPDTRIDALQFWGSVQGLMLLEYGMSPEQIEDPFADYSVEIWLVGRYVIKAEINGDPLGKVPYHFASFRKRNGSLWGSGVPEIISDCQDACNAAARSLINNMAISSGPQVMYDISQLPAGESLTDMYPMKIWQINGEAAMGSSSARAPIQFFMPPSVARELMEVYKFFSEEADNKTGVPKYSYGGEAKGGALGTATGFTMMMNNAARGIKQVVRNVDKGIIAPSIIKTHEFQLLYFKDPEYFTGDIKLIAKGSSALVAKEQAQIRRNELLNVVLSRPAALEVVQLTGLAQMLREIFKGADFKSDDIVPTKEQLEMRMQNNMMAQQQQQIEAQTGQETDPAGNKQSGKDFQIV